MSIPSGITRRGFLQGTAALGLTAAVAGPGRAAKKAAGSPWRGVSLGGWLVLEKWLTPSLFAGLKAVDEATFCEELGGAAKARLEKHRRTFLQAADFRWMAAHGLNAVRLPVGYWVLEGDGPYLPAAPFLDWAMDQAAKAGLGVLIDLHGAPGSQNGWDHSGRQGELGWASDPKKIDRTVDVIEALAKRYASADALMGIELLNEPRWDVPIETLKDYYRRAALRVRAHLPPGRAAVVFHDGFRPDAWQGFLTPPEIENAVLDTHQYQCYAAEDVKRPLGGHIQKALVDRKALFDTLRAPLLAGEWSLALPGQAVAGLTPAQTLLARRAYADAQLLTNEAAWGWFFWTYKAENSPQWSYRESVARGWLPASWPQG